MTLAVLTLAALTQSINPDLKSLAAEKEQASKANSSQSYEKLQAISEKTMNLVDRNILTTGEEFRIAADNLVITGNDYENARVRYELLYTAVAMSDDVAKKSLADAWDTLMMSLGRKRPIGAVKNTKNFHNADSWKPDLAPKGIINLWLTGKTDTTSTDSAEVKKMFDDDQNIRSGELTMKDWERMAKEDAARLKRIKQMVRENLLKTGNDYFAAAFLFQHGDSFDDYQMAHQLSVCSMLLGNKGAKWIGAASYDRMLRSIGHKQRWGTQYRSVGSVWSIQPYEAVGMCENQRKSVVGKTLEQAIAFKGG
jgi:hypothetical protein